MEEKVEIQYPKTLAFYWDDETNKLNVTPVEIEVYKISDTKVEINIVDFKHPEVLDTTHKYNTFVRNLKGYAKEVSDYNYQDLDVSVIYEGKILEYKQYTGEELERIKKNNEELATQFKSLDNKIK